jgi:hypothetical protein
VVGGFHRCGGGQSHFVWAKVLAVGRVEITSQFEAILAAQLENGYGSKGELALITYERLQVNIQLLEEKRKATDQEAGKTD